MSDIHGMSLDELQAELIDARSVVADYNALRSELATMCGPGKPRIGERLSEYWIRRVGETLTAESNRTADARREVERLRDDLEWALGEAALAVHNTRDEAIAASRKRSEIAAALAPATNETAIPSDANKPVGMEKAAPGVYVAKESSSIFARPIGKAKPVCATCNDTHAMEKNGTLVMCTQCPVPCFICRGGPTSPFCAVTPCGCHCHPQESDDR